MWDKRAQYVSNHDGDNAWMTLDQGFFDTKTINIRLLGVFAPELKDPGGPECKEFVERWFRTRQDMCEKRWCFIVTTARLKNDTSELKTLDRYLGIITTLNGAENLNRDLLQFITDNNWGRGVGAKEFGRRWDDS